MDYLWLANRSSILYTGAFLAVYEGKNISGDPITLHCVIHISESVNALCLSYGTMLNLSILDCDFSVIGKYSNDFNGSKLT